MKLTLKATRLYAPTSFFKQQGKKTMSHRDEYVTKMKLQLDELNTQMDDLEARAKASKEEARDKYREEMAKLHHQSQLAKGKLDDMKSASEEAWESMVTEMEKVRDAFVHSFSYFKSQI